MSATRLFLLPSVASRLLEADSLVAWEGDSQAVVVATLGVAVAEEVVAE